MALTMLEVVGLAHVYTNQRHQLQLGQTLSGGGGQRQEVAQVGNLGVDQISAQLGGAFGRFVGIKAAGNGRKKKENS